MGSKWLLHLFMTMMVDGTEVRLVQVITFQTQHQCEQAGARSKTLYHCEHVPIPWPKDVNIRKWI